MADAPPQCSRCGAPVRAPSLWSSRWRCDRCGDTEPLVVCTQPQTGWLDRAAAEASVPVWLPTPMPVGFVVTGLALAGDPRHSGAGSAVCLSGPHPLGGLADVVLIAEEPGVGLGRRYAGSESAEPVSLAGASEHTLVAGGHMTALWTVPSAPDRSAYVGEAGGLWLWVITWPASANLVLLESVHLADVRSEPPRDVLFGAPTQRLVAS